MRADADVPASRTDTIENSVKQTAPSPTRTWAPTKKPGCVVVASNRNAPKNKQVAQLAERAPVDVEGLSRARRRARRRAGRRA